MSCMGDTRIPGQHYMGILLFQWSSLPEHKALIKKFFHKRYSTRECFRAQVFHCVLFVEEILLLLTIDTVPPVCLVVCKH